MPIICQISSTKARFFGMKLLERVWKVRIWHAFLSDIVMTHHDKFLLNAGIMRYYLYDSVMTIFPLSA